jgi:hypothetical protein
LRPSRTRRTRESLGCNDVPARAALSIPIPGPVAAPGKSAATTLFGVCEHDSVAPAAATLRHAARAPGGEIRTYPTGHFDIYTGELFEQVLGEELAFLKRHVPTEPR